MTNYQEEIIEILDPHLKNNDLKIANDIILFLPTKKFLPRIQGWYYNDEFVKVLREHNKFELSYPGDWNGDFQIITVGFHDIRLSYAIYHSDHLGLRKQISDKLFEVLKNIQDCNGLKLKDSLHNDRNYSD